MQLVMRLNRWDNIEALTPFPVSISPIGKSIGFMLVYDNVADLESDYPSSPFIGIERDPSYKAKKRSKRIATASK